MNVFTKLNEIPLFKYDFIMADPPWLYENWSKKGEHKNASSKYSCMSLDEVKEIRVGEFAQPDCMLWLWATNPMFPHALECLRAWGFTYKTAGSWQKMSKTWVSGQPGAKEAFGTGYILRSSNEPYLIGTLGHPKCSRSVRSGFMAAVRAHSQKPDVAFTNAERLMPNATRLELFSRQERPGWDAFGNEVGKFNPEISCKSHLDI